MTKITFALLALLLARSAFAGPVLDRVHAAHTLSCGVIKEEEDYSRATDHGNRAAFDLDMCKAVAVAALGAGAHFTLNVFPDEPMAVKALRAGKIDLLASASPTVANTAAGIGFGPVTFHDGLSILFLNNPAIRTAPDLAGKKICFVITSGSESALKAYAARKHISYIWYPFSEVGEMEAAFFTGNCAGLAGDVSQLANTRAIDRARAPEFPILPQVLHGDPLAPAYRGDDPQFGAIVHWTVQTLIAAEKLGVTQGNVDAMEKGDDEEIVQLLGQRFGTGALLGLDDHWGLKVLKAVGNYGEMFDRDLGAGSPLRIDRGEDRLWSTGGAQDAAPIGNP